MRSGRRRTVALALLASAAVITAGCVEDGRGQERWATTENTNAPIDWNAVNQAYKEAEGPTDFERRVNEIYPGDEVVSVGVHDLDARTQIVTGFLDRNGNGAVEDAEKIFTIRREVVGPEQGQYQLQGNGYYAGYFSPMWSIASGMLMGSMLSSALRPNYVPIYTRPYLTPAARAGELRAQRNAYRAQNPSRFQRAKPSGTGRPYNRTGGRGFGGRSGGTRFGTRRQARAQKPVRLTA